MFEPAIYDQLVAAMTSPTLRAYTLAGGTWAVRQFQDAPGGTIKGFEVNIQSDFFFLPAPFDKMGITANYTHISSSLNYLTGTVLSTTQTGTASDRAEQLCRGAVPQHLARRVQCHALLRERGLVGAHIGGVPQGLCQPLPARDGHLRGRHQHQCGRRVQLAGGRGFRL